MRVLSLQGGGCLGIGQAVALGRIPATPWDLIGGTSVGAINGACLSIDLPAWSLMDFYKKRAPQIFRRSFWQMVSPTRLWDCAKYPATELEAALRDVLGAAALSDCKIPFIATAIEMGTGRNVYFQSYGKSSEDQDEIIIGPDSGMKLWEVCRASSAAQTYFPAFQWGGMTFWDGGSSGNNAPDMLLFCEAADLGNPGTIRMLSIGAGRVQWPFRANDMVNPSIVAALKATVQVAYGSVELNAIYQAKHLLGIRHYRLNANLPADFAIDDAGPNAQSAEMAAWNAHIADKLDELQQFLQWC